MKTKRRAPVPLLPIALGLCLGLPGATRGQAAREADGLEARVVVRTGDPAPVAARFGSRFDGIATSPGGLAFIDGAGSALFLNSGGEVRTLAYSGQTCSGGETVASLVNVAAGPDGTLAFYALLADRRQGIFRIGPGEDAPEKVVLTQDVVGLHDGPATVNFIYPPVVDPEGAVLASIVFSEVPGGILRFPRGGAHQVVIESGDALGPGLFALPAAPPAVNAGGRIVFSALLETGESVLASLAPGQGPVVLAFFPVPTGPSSPFLLSIPPAINDAGQVAFLLVESGAVRVRRVSDGFSSLLARPGTPAPGGGTFTEIIEFPPAIDPAGNVLFAARRSNGRQGFYVASPPIAVLAEDGQTAGAAGSLVRVETRSTSGAAAALGADGAFHFAAEATAASGIFTRSGGTTGVEVSGDEAIPQPRFVSFLDTRVPTGGGGPSLAPDGLMIFDARVTGGSRGLFTRDRSGAIRVAAFDGDPAPGGGRYFGDRFAFHTINESGTFAFIGQEFGEGAPSGIALYYGSIDGGAVRRIVETEMLSPLGPAPGAGATDRVKSAPSRVNRLGEIAVPVVQADSNSVLMGYDGTTLFRIAGPGDAAPEGGTFTTAFTGSLFTGQPVPPFLDDTGRVWFGAQTSSGGTALYASRPDPGGGDPPARVLGDGDDVEGGRLSPFELQALEVDAAGRIAFQAIYSDEFDFADFVTDGGPASRLAARFDAVLDRGFVLSVLPLLAFVEEGRVGYGVRLFDGSEMILVREPGSSGDPEILVSSGDPSPDGGLYVSFGVGIRMPGRLASDGSESVALAAATTAGPEAIVLFGPANAAPTADAGSDLTAECAGPEGTEVTLDGAASSDPDGDALQYRWTGPFGEAVGPRPSVTLPLGVSIITLVVEDERTASAPDPVRVEVRDTLAPSIAAVATPSVLWPPDGRFVDVALGIQVTDRCDPAPRVVLQDITLADPGAGRPGAAFTGASVGTDDRIVSLRADRSGSGKGRTYTITYGVSDASGNTSRATAAVLVPHDRGQR